eukprot:Phypoly_transcript_05414.p1 GENE.Phypoly_transcript_05414~~Phypoly_transcript_05414.p1  ORF type:complete len:616 (+),score=129.68 Phypoly_transcript_05414:74-1849(+)
MALCLSLNSLQLCGGFSDIFSLVLAVGLCYLAWIWVVSPLVNAPTPGKPRPVGTSPSDNGHGKVINCTNPGTGEKLGEVKALTKEDVEACVRAAGIAQEEWARTSFAERSAVMYDLIAAILANEKEICDQSMADSGKTRFEAEFGEILTSCEKLRHLAMHGAGYLAPESRNSPLFLKVKSARMEYHPMGVIGIIIPWNYPFHNVISAAAAAIFAGNAACIKVSEWSTNSKTFFEKLIREVLAKRGHNPDLVQLLPGFGDTGEALVKSKGVAKILFIGSPATGKRVMAAAVENLTPVILELGGKDPIILFDDVPLDWALSIVMRGCFINNGQNCISSERVYVHKKIYDKFATMLANKVKETTMGPSLKGHYDFGAMTMPGQVNIVEDLVNDAVKNGAKVLAGGRRHPDYKEGNWFETTVLTGANHSMRIVNEEVFGPVALLLPFETEEELIKMVNGTSYGLGCSILSKDVARAERLGRQVVSGMVTVNDYGVSYLVQGLPFGGCKYSGFGRFNGPEGLRGFAREQTVVSDRFSFMRTPVPRLIQYPVSPKAPTIISTTIHTLYNPSWTTKITKGIQLLQLIATNMSQFKSVS